MPPPPIKIIGQKELERKLLRLATTSSKKAVRAGISAAITPVTRAIRSGVNGARASKEAKRAVRATIGRRLPRATDKVVTAKVGFGVGTTRQSIRKFNTKTSKKRRGTRKGGVGISTANVHWMVLGVGTEGSSKNRIKRVQKQTGRHTGTFRGLFEGVVERAALSSAGASLAAAAKKIWEVTKREALRKG